MAALNELVPGSDFRQTRMVSRRHLRLGVEANSASSSAPECATLLELSETGFLLEASAGLSAGDRLELVLPDAGVVEAEIVWSEGGRHGGRFRVPLTRAVVSAALLRSPTLHGLVTEISDNDAGVAGYSPRTKLAIWLGLGAIGWAIVIGAVALLM